MSLTERYTTSDSECEKFYGVLVSLESARMSRNESYLIITWFDEVWTENLDEH